MTDDFDDLPPPEADSPSDDGLDGGPHCEVCGNPIEWSGRGRRPKFCVDHKRRTNATGGSVSRSRKIDARLARIRDDLAEQGRQLGATIGSFVPVTGLVLVTRSQKFAAAVCRLAEDHPEWIDGLEKVARFAPVFDIAEFAACLVVAVGVDSGRVKPDATVAQVLGVYALWLELEKEGAPHVVAEYEQETSRWNGTRAPQFGPGPIPGFVPTGVMGE